ncbi:hypothetical protein [Maridesulfovibrio sp.]|uniref:hypothetical protein n=1 Tax=Maridesulfovibrio sp. TaxID=2795000 RepID=UPI002A187A9B|nr:hypothetical protein [Maridesulfovibrio sp.]
MKYILMVLVLILFVGVGAVNADAADREEMEEYANAYLDRCFSALFYKTNDRLLKWENEITIQFFGLPSDWMGVYNNYLEYYNNFLSHNKLGLRNVDTGTADISIFLTDNLYKTAKKKSLRSLLQNRGEDDTAYESRIKSWVDEGVTYKFIKHGDAERFIVLWNPYKFERTCMADRSPRFQMLKILYYAIAFVPCSTKSSRIIMKDDDIYPISYADMSYLMALYNPNVEAFSPLQNIRSILLDNMVDYLSSLNL